MWRQLHGPQPVVDVLRPATQIASYLLLFDFGRRLLRHCLPAGSLGHRLLGPALYAPLLGGGGLLAWQSAEPLALASILSRYLLSLPASLLAGYALLRYTREQLIPAFGPAHRARLSRLGRLAGSAFFAYGFFGGLVVPAADWAPASLFNQNIFLDRVGLPVQLFRALCAIAITITLGRLLGIFQLETIQRIRTAWSATEDALRTLREVSKNHARILDAVGDGVVGIDADGRVAYLNPAAEAAFGYPRQTMIGQSLHALTHHSRADGSPYPAGECPIDQALLGRRDHRTGCDTFWRHDGSSFLADYQTTPQVEDGRVVGGVLTFRDVTEQRRIEAELRQHREHLEDLVCSRTREERVRRQHEPRNPHADERHPRHDPPAPAQHHRAAAHRAPAEDRRCRQPSARHHQRHSRHVEDRGRQATPRSHGFRDRTHHRQRRQPDPRQGGKQTDRTGHRHPCHAGHAARRRTAHRADPAQFRRQCRQVHRARLHQPARPADRRR
nr:PAS domain-containing protein [Dechloromonas agitata]